MSQNRYLLPVRKTEKCCKRSTDDQDKDEQCFTKTGTHDHEPPRELERQSEAQRMLAHQLHRKANTHIKVHCNTKSMIHVIIDRQIAYMCETEQMAEFHIVLTLIKRPVILCILIRRFFEIR